MALTVRGYTVVNQDYNGDIEAIEIIGGTPIPASDPRDRGVSLVVR